MSIDVSRFLVPYHLRSTRIDAKSRKVRLACATLKHHEQIAIEPFLLSFAAPSDITDFTVDYFITFNEPISPVRGSLEFAVHWTDAAANPEADIPPV